MLTYYLNGVDLATFGVRVSGSSGILDMPKLKEHLNVDYLDTHGTIADLSNIKYQSKDIILSCFISASSFSSFNTYVANLKEALSVAYQSQLTIKGFDKPLSMIVYCMDGFNVDKRWRDAQFVGTFNLKFREPNPMKRILRFTPTVSFPTLTISLKLKEITGLVHWGDGTFDRKNEGGTYTRTYLNASFDKEQYIIITGDIDTSPTPNYGISTLLWLKII